MDSENINKESLKVYELFENPYEKYGDHQSYFAIHTLGRLYLDKSKNLKEVKKYLSGFSIHPYLILRNLDNEKESKIVNLIFNDINTNLFPHKNLTPDIIRKVENPSKDNKFMHNLLNKIIQDKDDEKIFDNSSKAKKLFYLYAEKEHLSLIMDHLEIYSNLYNRFHSATDSLDE
jgi:hypothetical protein